MQTKTAQNLTAQPQETRLSDSVALAEVLDAGMRFEAATFNLAARSARQQLASGGYKLSCLFGQDGLAFEAYKAPRFSRVFVERTNGVPFLSSSEINSDRPREERYLSRKLTTRLDDLMVRRHDVLVSRSGTIGNIGLAGARMSKMALSEDALRIRFVEEEIAGYTAAFLRTRFGRLQLQSVTYGSVIVHIEPEHLSRVQLPILGNQVQRRIGRIMIEATEKRDKANDLIDDAILMVGRASKLPPFEKLEAKIKSRIVSVSLSNLRDRFEGNFHHPVAITVSDALKKHAPEVAPLSDQRFVKEIRPITKFRKRTYVTNGGIPFLNSKQIFQIDPVGTKGLAKGAHTKDLPEIALVPGMLVITCSGTIGRVRLIPEYMKGVATSQDSTRIIPANEVKGGMLLAWLSSEYGQSLVHRNTYGSVSQKIDKDMIGSIPVPALPAELESKIATLVLQANRLRNEAYQSEHNAIEEIVARIERGAASKPSLVS